MAETPFTSSQAMKKPKPPLEVLQNLSKQLNAFQNTSQHFWVQLILFSFSETHRWIYWSIKQTPSLGGWTPDLCRTVLSSLCSSALSWHFMFLRVGVFSLSSVRAVFQHGDLFQPRLAPGHTIPWVQLPAQLGARGPRITASSAHLMLLLFTRRTCVSGAAHEAFCCTGMSAY